MSYRLYELLDECAGTDKYHCPQYVELELETEARKLSDRDIQSAINKYRNEKGRYPVVSVVSPNLQRRFNRILKDAGAKPDPVVDDRANRED